MSASITVWAQLCCLIAEPQMSFENEPCFCFPHRARKKSWLIKQWFSLFLLGHKGSLRILEWVAYPFSSRSSWPRNWTGIACIAGRFFTNWAIRESYRKITLLEQSCPLWYTIRCRRNFLNLVLIRIFTSLFFSTIALSWLCLPNWGELCI